MLRWTIPLFPTPEMRVMEGGCSEVPPQKPFRTLSSTNFARMNIWFCNVFSCSPTVSQHFLTARLKISPEDLNMGEDTLRVPASPACIQKSWMWCRSMYPCSSKQRHRFRTFPGGSWCYNRLQQKNLFFMYSNSGIPGDIPNEFSGCTLKDFPDLLKNQGVIS